MIEKDDVVVMSVKLIDQDLVRVQIDTILEVLLYENVLVNAHMLLHAT